MSRRREDHRPGPMDRQVDRRAFLRHLGALTGAASVGGLGSTLVPAPAAAAGGVGAGDPRLPEVPLPQETDPAFFTVAEAGAAIRRGDLSPLEVVDACLARVERFDPVLMAFNTVTGEAARQRARLLADGPVRGALHGIPLAIKDNYYTAGVPTTANSHIFADFVPDWDAEAWARLQARGAVLLGKTQMGPLATSRATTPDGEATTMNAWAPLDASVTPGGSSSGSATAVAARLALSSTGTQTGGSITGPSEAQGLTGLKPTMGRVSLRGIIPLTYTRDHPGPLARDAMDAAILLSIMAGPDPADPRTHGQPPAPDWVTAATPVRRNGATTLRWPTRIGVLPGYLDRPAPVELVSPSAPPEERARFQRAQEDFERRSAEADARRDMLEGLRRLGAEVVQVGLPPDWEILTSGDFNNVRLPERSEPFMEVLRRDVREFGVSLSPWINGLLLPGTEYLRGQRAKLLLLRRILDGFFSECDVVVQTTPFPFDMVGLPLIAFPIGFRNAGPGALPLGAVFGGQPWAEDRLLSVVAAWQDVTDWHRRRPVDPAGPDGDGGAALRGLPPGARGRVTLEEVAAFGE